MAKRYKTLEQWIAETIADTKENPESGKDGPCTAIALLYMQPTGGTKDLDVIKLTGKTWKAKDIADRFRGKAETFAQDLGGLQSFQLQAFFGTREPQAFHPFRVLDGEVSHGGADRQVKEDTTASGQVAFFMRHIERKDEQFMLLAQGFVARADAREERMAQREEKLREELNDATLIIREMIMEKRKDAFEQDIARMKFKRDSENQSAMLQAAPGLINTIAGAEVFPQALTDKNLLDQLCEKVAPDQVDQLVTIGLISAEMAGPLKLRIGQWREEQAKKAEAVKSLPVATGVPGESTNIVPIDRNRDKKGGGGQSGAPAAT